VKVVNIISHSFSGSTWVNLVLGSHPEAFSVGELKSVFRTGGPDCTVCGPACALWSRFDLGSAENPYIQIHQLTGKRVLIVNNSRKFLQAQNDPRIESYFIHLLRDGRVVTASVMRKRSGTPMWRAALNWRREVKRDLHLIAQQDAGRTTRMIYESAHADPEPEFRRLCQLIGLDMDPAMLRYWEQEHHYLAGNRGTLFAMTRKAEAPSAAAPPPPSTVAEHWDLNHYARTDPARFTDERWKAELSDRQLWVFAMLAGELNCRFGYPRGGRETTIGCSTAAPAAPPADSAVR